MYLLVRELMNRTSQHAQLSGSIGTLLGRRCRFDKWEPNTFGMHTPMTLEEAERTYGRGRIKKSIYIQSFK
jgi:DNA polymerase I-like protein with 3'-5' exonuclease and polymerase domains